MKTVFIDGIEKRVFRTETQVHGFTGLFVGDNCAAMCVKVPTWWWESNARGAVITSGTRVSKGVQGEQ